MLIAEEVFSPPKFGFTQDQVLGIVELFRDTLDHHLLALGTWQGIRIITPANFLRLLEAHAD